MNIINNPFIALLILAGFLYLTVSSYQRDKADEISYPDASIERLNRMSVAPHSHAAALQSLFNISDDEIAKPVNLFNLKGN